MAFRYRFPIRLKQKLAFLTNKKMVAKRRDSTVRRYFDRNKTHKKHAASDGILAEII